MIRIKLRVSPGAARSAIVGRHGAGWRARVAAAPEDGRANAELVRLLATVLDVPERSLAIVAGRRSRTKIVSVEGLDPSEVERRLERSYAEG
ncbi:MAG TPA: DUF167 domain-containing protein [Gaiellaceae bacterium]|nr:DUF167 domain-containing protein [Gaiellaceae bacterium]